MTQDYGMTRRAADDSSKLPSFVDEIILGLFTRQHYSW